MLAIADTITVDDVNAVARSFLSFASDYGAEAEVIARAEGERHLWSEPGPSRWGGGAGAGRFLVGAVGGAV
jgi:hypothetical protein